MDHLVSIKVRLCFEKIIGLTFDRIWFNHIPIQFSDLILFNFH